MGSKGTAKELFLAYQRLSSSEQASFIELLERDGQVGARASDAAWLLGLHRATIGRLVKRGRLLSNRKNGNHLRIPLVAILSWLIQPLLRQKLAKLMERDRLLKRPLRRLSLADRQSVLECENGGRDKSSLTPDARLALNMRRQYLPSSEEDIQRLRKMITELDQSEIALRRKRSMRGIRTLFPRFDEIDFF